MCWLKLVNPLGMFVFNNYFCYIASYQPGHTFIPKSNVFCYIDRILSNLMWTPNTKECLECIAMISEIKLIQNVLVVDFSVILPTGFIIIPVDCDKWLSKHWFIQKRNLRLIWISHWIIRSTDSLKKKIQIHSGTKLMAVYKWVTKSFAQLIYSKM